MTHLQHASEHRTEADALFGKIGRSMLQALPYAACACDRAGHLLACNEQARHWLGQFGSEDATPEAQLQGLLARGRIADSIEKSLFEVLRSSDAPCEALLDAETRIGERLAVQAALTPLQGPGGAARAWLCSFQERPVFSSMSMGNTSAAIERKPNAERAQRQDGLFRQLLQALPVAVYTTEADGTITFFNEAAASLAGRRPSPKDKWCVSWKLLRLDGTPLPHDECPMAATLRDGRARNASQVIVLRSDDTRAVCEAYPTPLFDKSGLLVGAVNVLVDISERVDAEQSLRDINETLEQRVLYRTNRAEAALTKLHRREREFALLVESVLDYAIIMLDPAGDITHWNRGAERIYGYSTEEIVGRHFSVFHTPKDRAAGAPERYLATALREGRNESEGWCVRKDGSHFCGSSIIDPVFDHGSLVGFARITRDVTERKKIEAALVESERQARSVIDTAPDGFVQLDAQGRVAEWNPAAVAMFGWSREEAIGRDLVQLIVPEDERARFADRVSQGSNPPPHDAAPVKLRTRTGDPVTVELNFGARKDCGNDSRNLFIRDIGTRMSIEAQLRQAQKMEAVGMLAGGIAHDFNNLLQGIIGAVEIVNLRIQNGDIRDVARFVDGALNSAQRAAALTHRLLSFSRKQPLDPQPVDANQLVASMGELLRRTMGEGIALEFELADDLWSCLCDGNQLESALLNLSINARDAMPQGGRLTLRSSNLDIDESNVGEHPNASCGSYVLLSVTDTGTGIADAIAEHVFDPFFTTKDVGRGTGLGLSMVYGFAQQSGGFCEIRSKEGKGTTVRIGLPRHLAPARKAWCAAPARLVKGTGELVLVVEDESVVRGVVVQVLDQLGYATLEAASGEAALDLLLAHDSIELLISDIGLPGMNGRMLAQAAHTLRPRLKILLMSGYAPDKLAGDQQAAQKWPLVSKPFSTVKLARCIRMAMRKEAVAQTDPTPKDET